MPAIYPQVAQLHELNIVGSVAHLTDTLVLARIRQVYLKYRDFPWYRMAAQKFECLRYDDVPFSRQDHLNSPTQGPASLHPNPSMDSEIAEWVTFDPSSMFCEDSLVAQEPEVNLCADFSLAVSDIHVSFPPPPPPSPGTRPRLFIRLPARATSFAGTGSSAPGIRTRGVTSFPNVHRTPTPTGAFQAPHSPGTKVERVFLREPQRVITKTHKRAKTQTSNLTTAGAGKRKPRQYQTIRSHAACTMPVSTVDKNDIGVLPTTAEDSSGFSK
ncbi:hypothetical protein EIP86_000125 [Pleurotus ostreatoroseus]|nr:hypothetical protein EIP86_000125 [Pleurotus ostreatoroseus]